MEPRSVMSKANALPLLYHSCTTNSITFMNKTLHSAKNKIFPLNSEAITMTMVSAYTAHLRGCVYFRVINSFQQLRSKHLSILFQDRMSSSLTGERQMAQLGRERHSTLTPLSCSKLLGKGKCRSSQSPTSSLLGNDLSSLQCVT